MTTDTGVRDMLSFLIARDTMHQNQWLAAIEELKAEGLEMTPCPSNFKQDREFSPVAYQFQNFSRGNESGTGRWAQGPSPDGKGTFEFVENPVAMAEVPLLSAGDPKLYGTPPMPIPSPTP
jgi:Mn-containing catalase